jgi:hypothetical protein
LRRIHRTAILAIHRNGKNTKTYCRMNSLSWLFKSFSVMIVCCGTCIITLIIGEVALAVDSTLTIVCSANAVRFLAIMRARLLRIELSSLLYGVDKAVSGTWDIASGFEFLTRMTVLTVADCIYCVELEMELYVSNVAIPTNTFLILS